MASWKAPSPGSTTASASATTRGSCVTTARMPSRPSAFSTLPRLPSPVVDDRDHGTGSYRLPFVDGTPVTRGLSRVASASARPTALNTASAMWCRFSP